MKKFLCVLMITLITCSLLTFTGCQSKAESIVGTWESEETITINNKEMRHYWVFKKDGTAYHYCNGPSHCYTYEFKDDELIIPDLEDYDTFSYDDEALYVQYTDSGETDKFQKIN